MKLELHEDQIFLDGDDEVQYVDHISLQLMQFSLLFSLTPILTCLQTEKPGGL